MASRDEFRPPHLGGEGARRREPEHLDGITI
jgi:hypothetical protein